jgi:hypothetical protein
MSGKRLTPALAIVVALVGASQARCQAPPPDTAQAAAPESPPVAPVAPPAAGAAPSTVTPAAPAFKAGDGVTDRDGNAVGAVQTLTETPAGPMVVVRIDGKMVSLPQATLKIEGNTIVSSQTKAQMLAAAGAPG